jgi:hypothetical protein
VSYHSRPNGSIPEITAAMIFARSDFVMCIAMLNLQPVDYHFVVAVWRIKTADFSYREALGNHR